MIGNRPVTDIQRTLQIRFEMFQRTHIDVGKCPILLLEKVFEMCYAWLLVRCVLIILASFFQLL